MMVAVAMAWLLASCTQTAEEIDSTHARVFDHLKQRASAASSVDLDRELDDWLPNQLYRIDGQQPRPIGDGIVVGEVTKVQAGRAYTVAGDAETGTEVPHESRDALWRTVDVTLDVSRAWGKANGQKVIRFGLSIDGSEDPADIMSGLRSLDSTIVVLAGTGFFKYDHDLYNVARNGTLIGTVDAGVISFPALDADEGKGYLDDTSTIDALEEQASRTPPVITVENGVRE